jgi:hypothetical protein
MGDDEEGETFRDLVHKELKDRKVQLPTSELIKLEEALFIYDEVMEVIQPNDYLLDEDMTIAERIVDMVEVKDQSKQESSKITLFIDPAEPYKSMVALIMIAVYGESLQADAEIYKELLKETYVTTFEQQRAFLLYTLIPIYNGHVLGTDLTKIEAEVSNALGNSANPLYNSGVSRYLREKYGKKFYITYWKLMFKEIENFNLITARTKEILNKLKEIIEVDEAENYTPGTIAYKETIDAIARRNGKLSKECDTLDYDELITLAKMYVKDASLTTLCSMVNSFKDRLDLEQPCDQYTIEDLLDVLTQLIDVLPKIELCSVFTLLNKPIIVPVFNGKRIEYLGKDIVKIWRQIALTEDLIKELSLSEYNHYKERKIGYSRIMGIRQLIYELTRKDFDNTRLLTGKEESKHFNIQDLYPLQRSGSQISIILEGSISIEIIYNNEWVYEIVLNAGDVIETNFPGSIYGFNEDALPHISQISKKSERLLVFYAELGDRTLSNIQPLEP